MAQGGLNIFSGDLFTDLAVLKSKHSEDSDLVVFKRRVRTPVETPDDDGWPADMPSGANVAFDGNVSAFDNVGNAQ